MISEDSNPSQPSPNLEVLFRGNKIHMSLTPATTVRNIKSVIVSNLNDKTRAPTISELSTFDIKLMHKGKILDNDLDFYAHIKNANAKTPKTIKLLASGISKKEELISNSAIEKGIKSTRIKDDLSEEGRMEIAKRQMLGRQQLYKASKKDVSSQNQKYGFGKIETLPNLPNEAKAKALLNELMNDPGVKECMIKHKWHVPILAELYPKGNVGKSPVCVMGLNQNKGQKILLRLRTDDLKGFRKILSVKKVLYHELAHNVHSNHDNNFYMLNRQIEKECNEWNNGYKSLSGNNFSTNNYHNNDSQSLFMGGTGKLGGQNIVSGSISSRELAARAALLRLSGEEEEIQLCCGCSDSNNEASKKQEGKSQD